MGAIPKHPEAHLWPSEVVTLGLLHAHKGVGNRAFYRWLTRDYRPLFPRLPERTRLFRLFRTHHDWTQAFLAAPTVLGVIDTYGVVHQVAAAVGPYASGLLFDATGTYRLGFGVPGIVMLLAPFPAAFTHPEGVPPQPPRARPGARVARDRLA